MLDQLAPARTDSLMELAQLMQADSRTDKVDLGVGTYRDEAGAIPIMRAVKLAEQKLLEEQRSKGYLGPVGDRDFALLLQQALFALPEAIAGRLARVQTPGGTGALRLALQLLADANPKARVWVGTPTWPAHAPIIQACGLAVRTYEHLDARGRFNSQELEAALEEAVAGDIVLLHGCCHNPTGVDLPAASWGVVSAAAARKGLLPLVDLAYPGLGDGVTQDVAGVVSLLSSCENALVAVSCSKSFGLYRDRTGALMMLTGAARATGNTEKVAAAHARLLWSNPPDHGAAVVRLVLSSPDLTPLWRAELDAMRIRVNQVRAALAALPLLRINLSDLTGQRGMFAVLPIATEDVRLLRERHAIYVDASRRINVAGLNDANLGRFAAAMAEIDEQRAYA